MAITETIDIPSNADDVTAEWLGRVTGFDIDGARPELIGVGVGVTSAVYRLHLSGPSCPASMVMKLPALDPAAVFTSTVLRMYHREVGFYNHLADQSPIRVPKSYYGVIDDESAQFVLLIEDLADLRAVDQVAGMELADAERAIDALAAWQARWWGQAEAVVDQGLGISLGDPIYPAVLPMVFTEGWEKVAGQMELPACIREVGEKWVGGFERLLQEMCQGPTTLAHGDYRADNMLFDRAGDVVLLDFQLIGSGTAAYDLAYFVTQSLDADLAADHERALFDRWLDGLRAAGVPEADLGHLWEDYRKAALFCLCYPIVASRGMDFADPRQLALVNCMNTRYARAVDQLELAALF
jgi:hypothetical protein